jgi:hypothetical protein
MVAETFIGRFFVPAIFYVVERISGAGRQKSTGFVPAETPGEGD